MEITFKEAWADSRSDDYEVVNANIVPENKKEGIFVDYDTDFLYRKKDTGEIRLPHRYPDGSLGFLPLKGFETGENTGLYSVNIDKLKDSYPDFTMKVYRRPSGKEFELRYSGENMITTFVPGRNGEQFGINEDIIQYELTGRDVFDFLEVEMRAELEIEHLAETNPILYAELSHSSRTSIPQFSCIEFPDIDKNGLPTKDPEGYNSPPVWYAVNPTQLSLVSKLKEDYIAPHCDAMHIVSLLAQNLAYDNERERQSYDESLALFQNMLLGDPIESVSYAVYHNTIDRKYGEWYVNSIEKGLNYLAKQGFGYDEVSRMVYSKDNLFRDDPLLMSIARKHMYRKSFQNLCDTSAKVKKEASLGTGIQRSR